MHIVRVVLRCCKVFMIFKMLMERVGQSSFIGNAQRKGHEMKRPIHALMIDDLMVFVIFDMNYVLMSQ